MSFEINDTVMVILKKQGYFDPWDGRREVPIIPKSRMEKELLELNDPDNWSNSYKAERFRGRGILAIKSFVGYYVGKRDDALKIKPLYGLQDPESEYFIVFENQIKKIARCRLK